MIMILCVAFTVYVVHLSGRITGVRIAVLSNVGSEMRLLGLVIDETGKTEDVRY